MLYPGVRDIIVQYHQRGEGLTDEGRRGRLALSDRSLDPRMLLPCANPACRKGGFWLRRDVDALVRSGEAVLDKTWACAGFLGPVRSGLQSPGQGPPRCPNTLEARIEVVRR